MAVVSNISGNNPSKEAAKLTLQDINNDLGCKADFEKWFPDLVTLMEMNEPKRIVESYMP